MQPVAFTQPTFGAGGRLGTVLAAALSVACFLLLAGCENPGWSYPTAYDAFSATQGYEATESTKSLAVAAACIASEKEDKGANLTAIAEMVALIMHDHPDTDVIAFHELSTSWLTDQQDPRGYYASVAETIPGPSTDYVADLAKTYAVAIVFGLAEIDAGRYYNSQAMLEPDGTLVVYRKRGLNQGDISNGCSPGSGPVTAEVKGVPVTFAICSDYQDEAVIRDLSTVAAPVVLASLVTSTRLNEKVDFFSRALSKWVVWANGGGSQLGLEFPGFVFIADPTGAVHHPASGAGAYSWARIGVRT